MPSKELPGSCFVGCGLECTMHGDRDCLNIVGHIGNPLRDFRLFASVGADLARTGLRTRLVNPAPGIFKFGEVREQTLAAKQCGMTLLWDMCHNDYPRDIADPCGDEFTQRIVDLALAFCTLQEEMGTREYGICVVNEILCWKWTLELNPGYLLPYDCDSAVWQWRCIITTFATIRAVRKQFPYHTIWFHTSEPAPLDLPLELYRKMQAYDGETFKYLILGMNPYPNSMLGHAEKPGYFTREALRLRKQFPNNQVIFTENGAIGEDRLPWFDRVMREAQDAGIERIIMYPAINHRGWNDNRIIEHGIWNCDEDRTPYLPLVGAVKRVNGVAIPTATEEVSPG